MKSTLSQAKSYAMGEKWVAGDMSPESVSPFVLATVADNFNSPYEKRVAFHLATCGNNPFVACRLPYKGGRQRKGLLV